MLNKHRASADPPTRSRGVTGRGALAKWLKRGGLPLVYVLLALAMTYPLVLRLSTHYVGTGGDILIFPWNDWWCRKCLLEGRSPYFTAWLFHPQGVSLIYHNFAWLNTGMWLPLSPLIGPIAAHNVIFIFNIALGGIGMHLLVRYLTRDHRAAFIAGLIFAFWPVRMSHYNHPNMVSVGWMPLFFLFLVRTIRQQPGVGAVREPPKWKPALLGGLFLALTGIARWLHLQFAGGILLVYLAYSALFERRYWNRRTVAALALTFALALALMAPLLSPLVVNQIQGGDQGEDIFSASSELKSVDLVTYFVPDRSHPLFEPWLRDLWSRTFRGAYLGYGALALAAIGVLRGQRDRWVWLLIGAGLAVMALGPQLQVAGRLLDVTLPYAWVQDWPVVRVVRHPNRFTVPMSLPVAMLAGYGAAWFLSRRRRPWLWTAGLGLLILFEYLPWPYPTVQPSVPSFYHQLAREPGDFAVLDLPLGARTVAKPYMYYSTFHEKRLVEGHVSRLPASAYEFIDSVPMLRELRQSGEMDPAMGDISRQLSLLADADVRYVILHPKLVPQEQFAGWRDWMAIAPLFEDEDTFAYRTQPRYGRDFEFVGEAGDGIGVIDAEFSTRALDQDGWLEATVLWGTSRPPGQDWLARLALVAPSGAEAQAVDFEPCADWPTSEWGADGVARGRATLQLDPYVAAGTYEVVVELVDPATGAPAGRPVSLGQVKVQAVERVFEPPQVEVPLYALFGDELRLLGYDVQREPEELHLILHWRTRRRMDVAYKFFVHLFDAETGKLVAQADVMPHNWTYPTHWWERGEVVSDEIVVDTSAVAPGSYRVSVGVYDPETGTRLPATDPSRAGEVEDHWVVVERLVLP